MKQKTKSQIQAIDLFCGAGGLTHGLEKAGIDVKLGVDFEKSCEFAYSFNNRAKFLKQDICTVQADDLKPYFQNSSFTLLAGCAPCQVFSAANPKNKGTQDKRYWLLNEFARLIEGVQPDLIAMENVPRIASKPIFTDFVDGLKKQGYKVNFQIIHCQAYGIPQTRVRLILLASKLDDIDVVDILSPEQFGKPLKTVRDTIAHLPKLFAGACDPNDPLHIAYKLSELDLKRIRATKHDGGMRKDWPFELLPLRFQKNPKLFEYQFRRLVWDKPAQTILTQFNRYACGPHGHPEQDRGLSLREGALLQTFPEYYQFSPTDKPLSQQSIAKMIGNAVPVLLGELIGQSLKNHVKQHLKQQFLQEKNHV